jgi:hypothetical protein
MKLEKLRLILDVDFDPQGVSTSDLKQRLHQVVQDATNNGTLTGDLPATVEKYNYTVTVRRPKRSANPKRIHTPCPHCGREENGKWFSPCPSDDCPSHDASADVAN